MSKENLGKSMSKHDPWGSLCFPESEASVKRDIERGVSMLVQDMNKLATLNEEHSAVRDVILRKIEDIKDVLRLAEVAFIERKKKEEGKRP